MKGWSPPSRHPRLVDPATSCRPIPHQVLLLDLRFRSPPFGTGTGSALCCFALGLCAGVLLRVPFRAAGAQGERSDRFLPGSVREVLRTWWKVLCLQSCRTSSLHSAATGVWQDEAVWRGTAVSGDGPSLLLDVCGVAGLQQHLSSRAPVLA